VPRSVLDAIKEGQWDFEPGSQEPVVLKATTALPGSPEKLNVLSMRLEQGLPLWHDDDRLTYNDKDKD
jgi:hypothetical protein